MRNLFQGVIPEDDVIPGICFNDYLGGNRVLGGLWKGSSPFPLLAANVMDKMYDVAVYAR